MVDGRGNVKVDKGMVPYLLEMRYGGGLNRRYSKFRGIGFLQWRLANVFISKSQDSVIGRGVVSTNKAESRVKHGRCSQFIFSWTMFWVVWYDLFVVARRSTHNFILHCFSSPKRIARANIHIFASINIRPAPSNKQERHSSIQECPIANVN